jgi:hypothetical protein
MNVAWAPRLEAVGRRAARMIARARNSARGAPTSA